MMYLGFTTISVVFCRFAPLGIAGAVLVDIVAILVTIDDQKVSRAGMMADVHSEPCRCKHVRAT
ncbi:MAG: hypothetical protein EOM61_09470 [Bacteroidia bacterium]|nr:hypothetical protein [Bacteroidia bacterium]